jgi:hypothetical protein
MLTAGDRVWVWGGYDNEPPWLQGNDGYAGVVERFVFPEGPPVALIQLNSPISLQGMTTSTIALSLRYVGAQWEDEEVCSVTLCLKAPSVPGWRQDAANFLGVESHASYQKEEPNNAFKGRRAKRARP